MKVKSRICIKCKKRKYQKSFSLRSNSCKQCKAKYAREYRKTYKDTRNRTEYRKQYYYQNQKRFSEWNKKWRENNDRSQYYKEYRSKNLSAKVACYCRNRIRLAIKNGWKAESSLSLTGCKSWNEVKIYLESKFEKGMNWENMGEWHIDHIRPCSSFDLNNPKQQKQCFHYTNLQPLWAKDNLSKSNKY
jgi:hypothetical protein